MNNIYILPSLYQPFFTTFAVKRYLNWAPLESKQVIEFIAYLAATHLLPPRLLPPFSVWAVPFLPPVTWAIGAKLWLARPYGLSFTKDMVVRLHLLTQWQPLKTLLPNTGFLHCVHCTGADTIINCGHMLLFCFRYCWAFSLSWWRCSSQLPCSSQSKLPCFETA